MKVHCNEGVAIHIDPESCAGSSEAVRDALAGEHVGQPLNREIDASRVPAFVLCAEGNMNRCDSASVDSTRRALSTLACMDGPCAETGRPRDWPAWDATSGPHGEGEEPNPVKKDFKESDPAIVATNLSNNAEVLVAVQGGQGQEPRGMRTIKARAGHRTGKVYPMRWTAYDLILLAE